MKKIALTGVMGAGKSSVIRILKQLDIPVFDCDAINGELLQKGVKGHAALVRTYGDAVLDAQGNIDRSALSDLMFAKGKKQEVEALLHPLIKQRLLEAMSACARPLVVAEVPLLFEVGWQDAFDETWVVACEMDQILERLQKGRGIPREEALRRLAVQLPQKEKIALCDVVLYNNADEEALRNEVLSCVKRAGERNDENGGQL